MSMTTIAQDPDLSRGVWESAILIKASSADTNPLWIALAGFLGNSSSFTI